MSVHKAVIVWRRTSATFDYAEYNRRHDWRFDSISVAASAAPSYLGDPECVDPEEAMVASLSSCHMLTFLAVASRKGYVIDSYTDQATGVLAKNAQGRLALTRVTLQPAIEFGGERIPDEAELARMHEVAHKECFIANSVKTEVVIEPSA